MERLRSIWARVVAHRRNLVSMVLGRVLSMLGLAVGMRALTEYASPTVFGEARLLMGIAALVMMVTGGPLSQFVLREFHEADEAGLRAEFRRYVQSFYAKTMIAVSALMFAGLLTYEAFAGGFSTVSAVLSCAFLFAEAYVAMQNVFIMAANRLDQSSALNVARQWLLPFGSVGIIALMGDRPESLLLGQVVFLGLLGVAAGRLGQGAAAGVPLEHSALQARQREWRDGAARFALPLVMTGPVNWFANQGDRFLLATFAETAEVGRYVAVFGLVSQPIVMAGSFAAEFLYPLWFRKAAQEDQRSESKMFAGMMLFMVLVSVSAVVSVYLAGGLIVKLMLAEQYREGAVTLMTGLAAGHSFQIMAYTLDMKAYAAKRTWHITAGYWVSAAVSLTAYILLIPGRGALGAVYANGLGKATYFATMAALLWWSSRQRPIEAQAA